jgi:hypothetical protein
MKEYLTPRIWLRLSALLDIVSFWTAMIGRRKAPNCLTMTAHPGRDSYSFWAKSLKCDNLPVVVCPFALSKTARTLPVRPGGFPTESWCQWPSGYSVLAIFTFPSAGTWASWSSTTVIGIRRKTLGSLSSCLFTFPSVSLYIMFIILLIFPCMNISGIGPDAARSNTDRSIFVLWGLTHCNAILVGGFLVTVLSSSATAGHRCRISSRFLSVLYTFDAARLPTIISTT